MKSQRKRVVSLFASVILLIALAGLDQPANAASPASITIHKLVCPSDVSGDIYNQCHDDRLAYIAFDIKGQEVVTDEQGEVSTDVMYGKVPITEDASVFYAYEGAYVFCLEQTTQEVLFDGTISNPLVTIQTDPGAEVICDWYNLIGPDNQPVDLRITKNTCPLNATSISKCIKFADADVDFAVNGQTVTTDATGTAYLDIESGAIDIAEDPNLLDGYVAGSFVRCWTDTGDVLFNAVVKKGGFSIETLPGTMVVCNVTNLPKTLPTPVSIVIHKATCPENTTGDIFSECHENRLPGIDFTVNTHPTTTSDNGIAVYWLDPGTITIKEDLATFNSFGGAYVVCSVPGGSTSLFDGPIDTNSVSFKAKAGQIVVCDWYNLTGAAAQAATITIHKAECSIQTPGSLYDACHDNRVSGIGFQINGKIVTTDGNGVAQRTVDDTLIDIAEDPDAFNSYLGARVYCSDTGSGDVLFDESLNDNVAEFTVDSGAEVVCDWYNLTN